MRGHPRIVTASASSSLAVPRLRVEERERIVAELAVPIHAGGQIEGLLFVANRATRPFTDADETVLAEPADHAGIAIRNARLFAESEQRRRAAERLAERSEIRDDP